MEDGIQGCCNSAAYFYFVAFTLIVTLVFLNLFIAIILEGFAASAAEQKVRLSDESMEAFARAWLKYDPLASEMIHVDKLDELLMDLIVEEMEMAKKDHSKNSINLNLSKVIALKYYTKWKRNLID